MLTFAAAICLVGGASTILVDVKPGVYEEVLGQVAVTTRTVQAWFKIDIKELETEMEVLGRIHDKLTEACEQTSTLSSDSEVIRRSCKNFNINSVKMLQQLSEKMQKLTSEEQKEG